MTERLDDTEVAIRAIRRITTNRDLDMVAAVLTAKRLELVSSRRGGPGPRNNSRTATNPAKPKPKAPAPQSKLDPSFRRDPLYRAYVDAQTALNEYCRKNKCPRSGAPQAVREPFQKALDAWIAKKAEYKLQPGNQGHNDRGTGLSQGGGTDGGGNNVPSAQQTP